MMAKKSKSSPAKPLASRPSRSHDMFDRKDGLGSYIEHPEKSQKSDIIYYDKVFVVINDLFPKSSVHCLLLPRDATHTKMHPFDAFEDSVFLASCLTAAAKLKRLVAKELQSRYARFSVQETGREAVLNGEVVLADGEDLPKGRDWEKEVKVGIHARPSMNHLHVHVMSVDRYSECMKHRKHYNSFATPFFVELDAFPLAGDDPRRHPERQGYLNSDLKCWRCGENFGNKFARLKEHLAVEFELWKRE